MSWLHSDLSRPVRAPFTSSVLNRGPLVLIAVVWQFCVDWCERFRKRDTDGIAGDETFCNFFAVAIAEAMGVPIPQLRVNALAVWFADVGVKQGWELVTEHTARAQAEVGQLVFAVWVNPTGEHGHIAVVMPALGEEGTFIAQAGSRNFSRGLLERGFGLYKPMFYSHP